MRQYEMVMIINPAIAEEGISNTIEKINHFITERGGENIEIKQWGKRKLAYSIKHSMEGNYVLARFRADPKLTTELEANLRISEDILRHLLVRVDD